MQTNFLVIASLLAALAVISGAFGAHSLENYLEASQLQTWETAVRYQFYHCFALFFLGWLYDRNKSVKFLKTAGILFIIGIFLFSGSLYLLSCKNLFSLPLAIIGPMTPLGGLCFIIAWVLIALNLLKNRSNT